MKRGDTMTHKNLQEALEKISNDASYCETIVVDPDRLKQDFGLSGDDMEFLKTGGVPGMKDGAIRPVAICCTCYAAPSDPTRN